MMVKMGLMLVLCIAAAHALPQMDRTKAVAEAGVSVEERFEQFVERFDKDYRDDAEKRYRLEVFRANMEQAQEMNADEGESIFGATKYADLTPLEFSTRYLRYIPQNSSTEDELKELMHYPDTAATASSVNWADKGATTPVKDQGQCGSCWAFSCTEQIESDVYLQTGKLKTLAPQQIVSCDKTDLGCNGGDTPTCYKYVEKAGGLETEASYPYTSGRSGKNGHCTEKSSKLVADIAGYKYVSKKGIHRNETGMADYVGTTGPLSICVDASSWQLYDSGIIKKRCGKELDHCVQVVGYNKEHATPYWIIRNSWNTDWGEEGYIYVEMNKDLCGVASEATFVTGSSLLV